MTTAGNRTTVSGFLANLENVWGVIDELLGSLGPGDWSRKHGPDWTMADLPYHLSYFDREIVVEGIEKGPNVPREQQRVWPTFRELNAWNARKFAERPANQAPQQSVEQMQASRERIRGLLNRMNDDDLNRPVFIPICGCGWFHAGATLGACLAHTWNHSMELRLRLERPSPIPGPSATHGALSFYNNLLLMTLDKEQAANTPFTTVVEFTGPGGGAWTVRVANGRCILAEERAAQPDLVLSQSPETFVKVFTGILDPMSAIQSGEIQASNMGRMATYGALFPPISLDRVYEPMGGPAPQA